MDAYEEAARIVADVEPVVTNPATGWESEHCPLSAVGRFDIGWRPLHDTTEIAAALVEGLATFCAADSFEEAAMLQHTARYAYVIDVRGPGRIYVLDARIGSPTYGERVAGAFGNEYGAQRWIDERTTGARS